MTVTIDLRISPSRFLVLLAVLPIASLSHASGGGQRSSASAAAGVDSFSGGNTGGGLPIPASFFAMTIPNGGADYPVVRIGALGHPADFAWGFIEKSKDRYSFKGYDNYVNEAVRHGLVDSNGAAEVTITLGGYTPLWAAADTSRSRRVGQQEVCPSPPADIRNWTDFVTAVVNHYNGKTAPHVKYYELWNEFSSRNFWTGTLQDMVKLAAAAYPIIHTDPYSILLTPSVSGPAQGAFQSRPLPNGLTWMTSYLQAGGSRYADGGSFHGYVARSNGREVTLFPFPSQDSTAGCAAGAGCFGSIVTKMVGFRRVFDQNGLSGKPMLDTEGSWGKDNNLPDSDQEAAWVAQWYILQAAYYPKITQATWYLWGYPARSGELESAAGTPNQAGVAYGQVYGWLVGASFSSPCRSDSNSTWTCLLARPGSYQGLIVWNEKGSFSYSPARTYTQFRDLAGQIRRLSGGAITISAEPVLCENQSP